MGNCISHPQRSQSTCRQDHADKCVATLELPTCPALPIHEPTQSFWTFPPSSIASHGSSDAFPTHADVVIIGSGISAASFVRTLLDLDQAREDESDPLRVVMLEAQETSSGATGRWVRVLESITTDGRGRHIDAFGRNGGHINAPLYHDYEDLKQSLGVAAAQQIMRFRLAHQEVITQVAETEAAVDADCRKVLSVDVFFDRSVFAEAKRKLRVYMADMPRETSSWRVWEGEEARRRYNLSSLAVGCITTHAGAVHPYRFVTGILSQLLEEYPKYFQLFTQTPCTSIIEPSPTNTFYSLITPRGQLTASHVVHLTNAYVGKLVPGLADVVYRIRETMTAQRPGRALQFQAFDNEGANREHESRSYIFYDNPEKKGFDYLTQLPGGEHELMFGAGREAVPDIDMDCGKVCKPPSKGMYDVHSAAHVSGALPVYFGANNWGAEAVCAVESPQVAQGQPETSSPWAAGRVKALWSGVLSVSVDEFPWVGRIPSAISGRRSPQRALGGSASKLGVDEVLCKRSRTADPGEWVAAGYSGEGMVHAWLCARALALMVLGLDDVRDVETEGHYGAGQTANEWLPACFRITVARWKDGRRASKGLRGSVGRETTARGGAGRMKLYRGV